jgi:hypothetical protein
MWRILSFIFVDILYNLVSVFLLWLLTHAEVVQRMFKKTMTSHAMKCTSILDEWDENNIKWLENDKHWTVASEIIHKCVVIYNDRSDWTRLSSF